MLVTFQEILHRREKKGCTFLKVFFTAVSNCLWTSLNLGDLGGKSEDLSANLKISWVSPSWGFDKSTLLSAVKFHQALSSLIFFQQDGKDSPDSTGVGDLGECLLPISSADGSTNPDTYLCEMEKTPFNTVQSWLKHEGTKGEDSPHHSPGLLSVGWCSSSAFLLPPPCQEWR